MKPRFHFKRSNSATSNNERIHSATSMNYVWVEHNQLCLSVTESIMFGLNIINYVGLVTKTIVFGLNITNYVGV